MSTKSVEITPDMDNPEISPREVQYTQHNNRTDLVESPKKQKHRSHNDDTVPARKEEEIVSEDEDEDEEDDEEEDEEEEDEVEENDEENENDSRTGNSEDGERSENDERQRDSENDNNSVVGDISMDSTGNPKMKEPLMQSTPVSRERNAKNDDYDQYAFVTDIDNEQWIKDHIDDEYVPRPVSQAVIAYAPYIPQPITPVNEEHIPLPLKRKNEDGTENRTKRRRKKKETVPPRDDGQLEMSDDEAWATRKTNKAIEELLKKKQVVKSLREREMIASMISKESATALNKRQQHQDSINNRSIASAEEALKQLIEKGGRRPGGRAKLEKEARQKAKEVMNRTMESLDAIPESTIKVHINDITWDQAYRFNKDVVDEIAKGLLSGTMPVVDAFVRGYYKTDGAGEKQLYIHSGIENVLAYRSIVEGLNKEHPGYYRDIEDRSEPPQAKKSKTQPSEGTSGTKSQSTESRSEEVTEKRKPKNPFAEIYAVVLNRNSLKIPSHAISMYKTLKKEKQSDLGHQRPLTKIAHYMECVKLMNMNPRALTQSDVNTGLRKLIGYINETISRTLLLDEATLEILIKVMTAHEEFDKEDAVRKYMNARKISSHTADSTLHKVNEGTFHPIHALEVLADHDKRVHYLFRGLGVGSDESTIIENRLEDGSTRKKIKEIITAKKKLTVEKLIKIKRDPEEILKILERELHPCIGFKNANVTHLPVNDGKGEARCIVALISFADFALDPNTFAASLNPRRPTLLFITDIDDANKVIDLLKTSYPLVGTMLLNVDCLPYEVNGGQGCDTISCVVIGGRDGRAYMREEFLIMLKKAEIYKKLENWKMRKLIYDVAKASETITKVNVQNSVYVHSTDTATTAIVANLALNRVYTSAEGEELRMFTKNLEEAQTRRTEHGLTFEKQPPKNKKKKKDGEEEDDEEEDDFQISFMSQSPPDSQPNANVSQSLSQPQSQSSTASTTSS